MRELLGGKGANLAEMTRIGLPVPQGFTISTEACTKYYEDGRTINDEIKAQIMDYVEKMEPDHRQEVRRSGEPAAGLRPLRRRASMPGMMDTILNLGLNEQVVEVMAAQVRQPPAGPGTATAGSSNVLRRGNGSGQEVL